MISRRYLFSFTSRIIRSGSSDLLVEGFSVSVEEGASNSGVRAINSVWMRSCPIDLSCKSVVRRVSSAFVRVMPVAFYRQRIEISKEKSWVRGSKVHTKIMFKRHSR